MEGHLIGFLVKVLSLILLIEVFLSDNVKALLSMTNNNYFLLLFYLKSKVDFCPPLIHHQRCTYTHIRLEEG